jgi:putative DNA primase/helicase
MYTNEEKISMLMEFINRGLPIFPLWGVEDGKCQCKKSDCDESRKGKHPIEMGGFHNASTDVNQIIDWFNKYPNCNWGMATGNKSGIIVIDVDVKNNGIANWKQLVKENGGIPATLTVKTPHDGDHYYGNQPDNIVIKTSVSKLAPGIDVRANDSYIVIPPSSNYSMIGSLDNIADIPDWLLGKLLEKEINRHQNSERVSSMEVIRVGTRNDTLFKEACALRGRGYEYDEILASIQVINSNRTEEELDQREVETIVQSAMRYKLTRSIVASIEHPYTLTDVGNAERFISQYGEISKYCEQMKTWFIWNGKYWEKDNNNKIREFAHKTAKTIYHEASQCTDSDFAKKLGDWAKV